MEAHDYFDRLWHSGVFSRKRAYKKLAAYLGLSKKKTHIGHFDHQQCTRTIDFCKTITETKKEVEL